MKDRVEITEVKQPKMSVVMTLRQRKQVHVEITSRQRHMKRRLCRDMRVDAREGTEEKIGEG